MGDQIALLGQVLIPSTVFIIMMCLGFELQVADFKRIFVYPRAILTGIIGQVILMPTMAFLIAAWFESSLVLQIGIVLLAACPGGPLSNSFVYLGKGKVDLSVSLTAVNGFLALLTTPFIASLGIAIFAGQSTAIQLPILKTIAQIFLIAILPIILGMILRVKKSEIHANHLHLVQYLAVIMLVIHISIVITLNLPRIAATFAEMIMPALLFCISALTIGVATSKLMGLDKSTQFTIGIEVGLQNVVLAILIANVILKRPEIALFVLTYAIGALFILLPWVYLHRRQRDISRSKAVANVDG